MLGISTESTAKFLLDFCIKRLDYKQYLQSRHSEDHENRWANVEELLNQAADIADSGPQAGRGGLEESLPKIEGVEQQQLDGNNEALAAFLANITLSSDLQAKEDGQEQECITISTIHAAKGLEWPVVFIPAVYDGSIPHSRAEDTDEERRLLYVAMTRAQSLLYLTCPLQQSRSATETTLSSFLPPKLHRYFVKLGPDITDKVVRDMAKVLRRQPPSEEELVKGLQSLSEKESSQDNLWPADGSAKPRQWWDFEEKSVCSRKTSGSDIARSGSFQTHQKQKDDPRTCGTMIETTMTSSNSFTIASASMDFSTAAQQFAHTLPSKAEAEPRVMSREIPAQDGTAGSRSKKRKGKLGVGQASLTDFFAHNSFGRTVKLDTPKVSPEPDLPDFVETSLGTSSHAVPASFTAHRLSNKPGSLKRPRPLEEVSNSKRNEYCFLSSSPSRESHSYQAAEACRGAEAIVATNQEERLTKAFKPLTTMHKTSMDILQERKHVGVRKTLGVQRTMGGWENRKNK